jgi:organic radical activating enzyme
VKYPVAERFVAPQGEGLYTGTPMAFIRLVGCSVGQQVCTVCDTEFDRMREDLGGGLYEPKALAQWVVDQRVERACLTGGEPLDRDLRPLLEALQDAGRYTHVETSGTVRPAWLGRRASDSGHRLRMIGFDLGGERLSHRGMPVWVTVSPKPGYLDEMISEVANEVKVIDGGLGDGPGWPTLAQAVAWSKQGLLVYVQPRNERTTVDAAALQRVVDACAQHPTLRVSVQLHKVLRTR